MLSVAAAACTLAAVAALSGAAQAALQVAPGTAARPPPSAPAPAPAPAPARPSPKRALPEYDGRDDETTAGDVLVWVPRVALFPAYVVSEYLVRRPLGFLTVAVEQNDVIDELKSIFVFGPNNNIGVVPTALIDFGFRPSVGVYFFYDDLGMPHNDMRVHAATGGADWLRLTVADRIPIDDRAHVKVRAEGSTRPDWLYAGIGPRSLEANAARYSAATVEPSLLFHLDFGDGDLLEAFIGVKTARFGVVGDDEDPTVTELVAAGVYSQPPGFDTGYTAYRQGLELALDSRDPRPAPGTGARIELSGEHVFDLERPQRARWLRYGATLGGFLDLTGQNRVVSLALSTTFVDPLGDDEVPFTELAALGGEDPMRGFRPGRLRGRSALAATLEYRYPIWAFLDGSAQVAVGNAFSEHLSDFDLDLLRFSFLFGVRTVGSRDHSFDILIGAGTETFEQGAALQDIRFLFGATRGF